MKLSAMSISIVSLMRMLQFEYILFDDNDFFEPHWSRWYLQRAHSNKGIFFDEYIGGPVQQRNSLSWKVDYSSQREHFASVSETTRTDSTKVAYSIPLLQNFNLLALFRIA